MASGGTTITVKGYSIPDGAPLILKNALNDIGISEWVLDHRGRRRSNPAVEQYSFDAIGKRMNARTVPWCAYYINSKLKQAGQKGTRSGMARSFLRWGNKVQKGDYRPGDVCVIWRGRRNDGYSGHVFLFLRQTAHYVYGVGGNQGDKVCVQRFPKSRLLGVRRYRGWWKSHTLVAAAGSAVSQTAANVAEHMLPTPTIHKLDHAAETLEKLKGPLTDLAAIKPWLVGVLSIISIVLIVYAGYRRFDDHAKGKNT